MLFIKKLKPMTRDSGTEAVNRGKIAGVNFIVTPYNGGQGWKTGYRLNSSGAETELTNWEVTGFMPVTQASKVNFANINFNGDGQDKDYLCLYDSEFKHISGQAITGWLGSNDFVQQGYATLDSNGNVTYLDFSCLVKGGLGGKDKESLAKMAYFRLSAYEISDASIIAVDEEIVDGDGSDSYAWTNTGHAFVPADYEDRIIKMETDIATMKDAISGDMAVYGIVDSENNIIMTGTLESGVYTLKYMAEDGTTTDIGTFTM